MKQTDLDNRFDHHPPDVLKAAVHQLLRGIFKDVASVVAHECPEGREKSLAITKLEEALMWANASVARNELTSTQVNGHV